jgi:hypothetical protein
VQVGEKFELKINEEPFATLWDLERAKRIVSQEEKLGYKAKDYSKNYD